MNDVQTTLDALSSPIRREILWLVWDTELSVGAIASSFDVSAPTISAHLGVLRDAGLVSMVRDRNFRRYRARQDVLRRAHATLLPDDAKWIPADNIDERLLASGAVSYVVRATVDVPVDQPTTFGAFVDAEIYSRWLGVPVTIDEGRFSCTLEWGTTVRGTYDVVVPPTLIALRWDFEDNTIPVPGAESVGYLRFTSTETGTRVEVHQLVDTVEHAAFMEIAWTMVLGRLREGLHSAVGAPRNVTRRAPRPKVKARR